MKVFRSFKRRAILVVFLLAVLLFFLLVRILGTDDSNGGQHNQHPDHLLCSVPVTFVIRDVEEFDHDLPSTVGDIRQKYRTCDVLVLPDTVPYPPLSLFSEDVRVMPLDFDLRHAHDSLSPEKLIRTEYALFIPDGTRIEPDSVQELVGVARDNAQKVVAVGVGEHLGACVAVNPDLRKWTLSFSLGEMDHECDAFAGDVALLVHKSILANMSDPFARPINRAFYTQTKLKNIKISRYDDIVFSRSKALYGDIRSRWKRSNSETQRKTAFYRRSGFKKVVYPSGETEWYGCEKTSSRCFPTVHEKMPDFLYRGQWTPPCCLKALRETAKHVFQVLEEADVRYWLEGGSLLGAARYKDIIPWDYDVDIGIYREDIVKCDWLKKSELQAIVDDQGYVWEKAREGDFYRVQYSETNHLHVDIFPFYPKNGIMTKDTWFADHRQDCEFPEQYVRPLSKIEFAGMKASAPNNVKEFLEFKFGVGVIETPEYPNPVKKAFEPDENG